MKKIIYLALVFLFLGLGLPAFSQALPVFTSLPTSNPASEVGYCHNPLRLIDPSGMAGYDITDPMNDFSSASSYSGGSALGGGYGGSFMGGSGYGSGIGDIPLMTNTGINSASIGSSMSDWDWEMDLNRYTGAGISSGFDFSSTQMFGMGLDMMAPASGRMGLATLQMICPELAMGMAGLNILSGRSQWADWLMMAGGVDRIAGELSEFGSAAGMMGEMGNRAESLMGDSLYSGRQTTVLGSVDDLKFFNGQKGYNVLDPYSPASLDKNYQFVKDAVDRGDNFLFTKDPQAWDSYCNARYGSGSRVAIEQDWLMNDFSVDPSRISYWYE